MCHRQMPGRCSNGVNTLKSKLVALRIRLGCRYILSRNDDREKLVEPASLEHVFDLNMVAHAYKTESEFVRRFFNEILNTGKKRQLVSDSLSPRLRLRLKNLQNLVGPGRLARAFMRRLDKT